MSLKAEKLGNTFGYLSPFAKEARKTYRDFEARGKADDITVIVSQILYSDKEYMMNGLPRKFEETI